MPNALQRDDHLDNTVDAGLWIVRTVGWLPRLTIVNSILGWTIQSYREAYNVNSAQNKRAIFAPNQALRRWQRGRAAPILSP